MFPTGNVVDQLDVPEIGSFQATFINAGIPTIFLNAEDLGYQGTELQDLMVMQQHWHVLKKSVHMVQFRWG